MKVVDESDTSQILDHEFDKTNMKTKFTAH